MEYLTVFILVVANILFTREVVYEKLEERGHKPTVTLLNTIAGGGGVFCTIVFAIVYNLLLGLQWLVG